MDSFIASEKYKGKKFGMVFKKGALGLGYYPDYYQLAKNKKRKLDDTEEEKNDDKNDSMIKKILKRGDEIDVQEVTVESLPFLLKRFTKCKNKNEELRVKYDNDATKFMESELELHSVIQELHGIASSPSLIPLIINSKFSFIFDNFSSLLLHENSDIASSIVALLLEFTEPDPDNNNNNNNDQDSHVLICTALVDNHLECITGLIDNMLRLNDTNDDYDINSENNDEDTNATCIQSTLSIIENIIDVSSSSSPSPSPSSSSIASILVHDTKLLEWILNRLRMKTSTDGDDIIKSLAVDVLLLLIQSDIKVATNFHKSCILTTTTTTTTTTTDSGNNNNNNNNNDDNDNDNSSSGNKVDGIEVLLEVIHGLRKKETSCLADREYIETIFLTLSSCLAPIECSANRRRFLQLEGLELMVQCIKHRKLAASCALGVIKHILRADIDDTTTSTTPTPTTPTTPTASSTYTTTANVRNSNEVSKSMIVSIRLVEAGGLAYLFPLLMGRGLPRSYEANTNTKNGKGKNGKSKGKVLGRRGMEDHLLSIVACLCESLLLTNYNNNKDNDDNISNSTGSSNDRFVKSSYRLLSKLTEYETETSSSNANTKKTLKILKCLSLLDKNALRLAYTEQQLEVVQKQVLDPSSSADEREKEELTNHTFLTARRLEGGLSAMQDTVIILASCLSQSSNNNNSNNINAITNIIATSLLANGYDWDFLQGVLTEAISQHKDDDDADVDVDGSENSETSRCTCFRRCYSLIQQVSEQ